MHPIYGKASIIKVELCAATRIAKLCSVLMSWKERRGNAQDGTVGPDRDLAVLLWGQPSEFHKTEGGSERIEDGDRD